MSNDMIVIKLEESNSIFNRKSDQQNRTTTKQELDLFG